MAWSAERDQAGLRVVAIIELGKGLLVLLTGLALLALIGRDSQTMATRLIVWLHLNPAHELPRIVIEAAAHMTDRRIGFFAGCSVAYALVRLIEAYGLWHARPWAEWLAVISGGLYIPLELHALAEPGQRWPKAIALIINLAVVAYLLKAMQRQRLNRAVANQS